MHSPPAAIAWEFRQRHRWGLVAIVVYLIVLAAIKLVILGRDFPIDFDSPVTFALVFVVPVSSYFTYFIAVFTFGLEGDLAARQSMYPARMFTRPVSSGALAWWPMFFGGVVSVILWTATRLLALWPEQAARTLAAPALQPLWAWAWFARVLSRVKIVCLAFAHLRAKRKIVHCGRCSCAPYRGRR